MSALLSSLWPGLAIAGLSILAVLGLTRQARNQGAREARADSDAQTIERIFAAQKAAATAASSDKTNEQILRDGDGSWH